MSSPTFFLYGEAPKAGQENFLHLEPLDARSRPANWHIRPHRHDDLHHVFLLWSGAGEMRAASRPENTPGARRGLDWWAEAHPTEAAEPAGFMARAATAPCLLLVPAGDVHAFTFVPDTTGRVLTISDVFLRGLCAIDDDLAALFSVARCVPAGGEAACLLEDFDRLGRELAWHMPGHDGAVKAALLRILVCVLRLERRGLAAAGTQTADARLVARFREMIEARYRSHDTIGAYASSLGVSLSRLRAACRAQGSGAPLDIVLARRMLEAKRALLYSGTSVGEIAFSLGYDDVSYFVRLFHRLEGMPPGSFRRKPRSGAAEPVALM